MTDTEAHDTLIRLETKTVEICKRLGNVERELKTRQCMLHTSQIASIEKNFDPKVCSKNTEKIATIEKLTWASIVTVIGLIAKSFWSAVTT